MHSIKNFETWFIDGFLFFVPDVAAVFAAVFATAALTNLAAPDFAPDFDAVAPDFWGVLFPTPLSPRIK